MGLKDLLELVYSNDELADLDGAERRLALRELVAGRVSPHEFEATVGTLADAIDGFGPLTALMSSDAVTDILVNGPDEVWVERDGGLERTPVTFARDELSALVERLVGGAGARLDASCPIADARLADGSRVHVVLPPLAPRGPLVSIRRFPEKAMNLAELTARRMMTPDQAERMRTMVQARRTILISGGTGTGKTTLMNALLSCVPATERVVIIEETPELRPVAGHRVSLVARPSNVEDKGAVTVHDLVRAALRMRPDRLVVGEVRGAEALAALGALSTGHEGSLLTIHARSARHSLDRFVALALEAGGGHSEDALQRRAEDSFDAFVHLARVDGMRRVTDIVERS